MDEDLWAAYDRMGLSFQEHAADSAFNAHYDRPAVLAALGPVTGRRVLDAACGPGLYLRELWTGRDARRSVARRQGVARAIHSHMAITGRPKIIARMMSVFASLSWGRGQARVRGAERGLDGGDQGQRGDHGDGAQQAATARPARHRAGKAGTW